MNGRASGSGRSGAQWPSSRSSRPPRCSWRSRRTSSAGIGRCATTTLPTHRDAEASWQPNTLLPAGLTRTALGSGGRRRVPRRGRPVLEERAAGAAAGLHRRHATNRGRAAPGARDRDRGAPRPAFRARHPAGGVPPRGGAQLPGAAPRVPPASDRAVPAGGRARSGQRDAIYDLELALKLLRETGGGTAGGGDRRAPLPSPGSGRRARAAGSEADGTCRSASSRHSPPRSACSSALAIWARVVARRRAANAASSLGLPARRTRGGSSSISCCSASSAFWSRSPPHSRSCPARRRRRARRRGGPRRLRRDPVHARSTRAERADAARPQPRAREASPCVHPRHARRRRVAHRPGAAAPVSDAWLELVRLGREPRDRRRAAASRPSREQGDRVLRARRHRTNGVLPPRDRAPRHRRHLGRRDAAGRPRGSARAARRGSDLDDLRTGVARRRSGLRRERPA